VPGDSGSWVVDPENGDVYAMVIAASTTANETYCISMASILDSIRIFEGNSASLSLPGGPEYGLIDGAIGTQGGAAPGGGVIGHGSSDSSFISFLSARPPKKGQVLQPSVDITSSQTHNTISHKAAKTGTEGQVKTKIQQELTELINNEDLDAAVKERLLQAIRKKGEIQPGKEHDKAAENDVEPKRLTFIKVHRKYLRPETLDHYNLPWEFDIVRFLPYRLPKPPGTDWFITE
jgi:hypothetical protein